MTGLRSITILTIRVPTLTSARSIVAEHDLRTRVAELGKEITADYEGRAPLLVGVLKGAFMFMSDLARCIDLPVEFDFMAVSSYGTATKTSGVVRIVKDLDLDLSGRDVVARRGHRRQRLDAQLPAQEPAGEAVPPASRCARLLLKDGQQKVEPDVRYVGFRIPEEFVVGYGLDVGERYRNLPSICTYVGPGRP